MGVMTLFVHAPSDKAILDLDEHMTSVCKTEGESPVAVVLRSLSWKMGIWIWETGLDGSSEGKDHCCERAAYNLSVATSKFGNQQQNDQQLNVKVFNTSYVWDLFDTTVPKHISSLKIINDGSD